MIKQIETILNKPHKLLRKGDGGAGYTFETLLGIEENNLPFPDLNGVEIKTKKVNSKSLTTLFCYGTVKNYLIPMKDIVKIYGYPTTGRTTLNTTITSKPNNLGFSLRDTGSHIIIGADKDLICWNKQELQERFYQKMPKLLLVYSDIYKGKVTFTGYKLFNKPKDIGKLLTTDIVSIDIRCWINDKRIRDRGIAFRTRKIDQIMNLDNSE